MPSSLLGAQRSSWLTKSKLNFFPTKGNFEIAAKTKTKNDITIPITYIIFMSNCIVLHVKSNAAVAPYFQNRNINKNLLKICAFTPK